MLPEPVAMKAVVLWHIKIIVIASVRKKSKKCAMKNG
jgi:hypothetical protein